MNIFSSRAIIASLALLVGLYASSVCAGTAQTAESFVFLDADTSSFWRTAESANMTLPINFPPGATAATLAVTGADYSKSYPNITTAQYTLALPPATDAEAENVYDLTLTFNDPSVTVHTAKIGVISGLVSANVGSTRTLTPKANSKWPKVITRAGAVLPIPYGTTSFKVNGVETMTGLNGAQGWYALGREAGDPVSVELTVAGVTESAVLVRQKGLSLFIK